MIYAIRNAQHRLRCLQTDHTAVMQQIESCLLRLHAASREEKAATQAPQHTKTSKQAPPASQVVAVVDEVTHGSPAHEAGFHVGDIVTTFGSCTHKDGDALTPQEVLLQMQTVVKANMDRSVPVVVYREGEGIVQLAVTPRQWDGPGLLGCHLIPAK
eukprot:TRINITY_DN3965_c0_g1_i2.p2 TRINITY_DN3965_c0_g1~~TRINITY_DN3965_c0_g1_i2.p2  ORF type:complete len:157 (+),score=36.90 TRINITY_DN3965_c0_g1_i2:362-832(+)